MKNFISIGNLSKDEILEVLDVAKEISENPEPNLLSDKIIASLFFEPSTRTRLSFTAAGYRLGAKILGFESPDVTSLKKGESLRDTLKIIEGYSDIIVMRHFIEGAAKFATEVLSHPVINAGDGANEHPSQTLLDLYTIREELGGLENLKIAFVGDLKYGRTVHSLVKAMKHFKPQFYFVAPDSIQIPEDILEDLKECGIGYSIHERYEDIVAEVDVLYMTRIQRERFENIEEYNMVSGVYKVSAKDIVGKTKENMIILHPLPRVDEIALDVDELPQAKYFKQAKNGVPVRQAMYKIALKFLENSKRVEDFEGAKNTEKVENTLENSKRVEDFEGAKNTEKVENTLENSKRVEDFEGAKNTEKVENTLENSKRVEDFEGAKNTEKVENTLENSKRVEDFEGAKNTEKVENTLENSKRVEDFEGVKNTEKVENTGSKVVCKNKKCITHFEKTGNGIIRKNGKKYCYYCGKEI